jgi:hypothetical protein
VQTHKSEKKQAIGGAGTTVALIGTEPISDHQQDHTYNAAFN